MVRAEEVSQAACRVMQGKFELSLFFTEIFTFFYRRVSSVKIQWCTFLTLLFIFLDSFYRSGRRSVPARLSFGGSIKEGSIIGGK